VLSDALDRLGIRGVASGLMRVAGERRVAGQVITVTLGPAEGTPSRHLCTQAIELGGAGDVIVVEHHSNRQAAGWGGILSYAAKSRGIEGVIVDGMCRDVDEAVELDFPVYAAGAVPTTARSRVMETACQTPVVIGGVRVRPGDFVLADRSGVVFVPQDRIDEVLQLAEELADRERRMIGRIREGESVSAVMNHQYETMLKGEVR
jgi:regulator of RNase E activity RraA